MRAAAPDLLTWDPKDMPAFLGQLVCVNTEAMALAAAIMRSDPEAIIVLQKERFGALNAIRMPEACAHQAEGTVAGSPKNKAARRSMTPWRPCPARILKLACATR